MTHNPPFDVVDRRNTERDQLNDIYGKHSTHPLRADWIMRKHAWTDERHPHMTHMITSM